MQVTRCDYFIPLNIPKNNGQFMNVQDVMNIGYMSGRFGVNLNGNPNENNAPKFVNNGVAVSINSCTKDLFEKNLTSSGIRFNAIA